MGPIRIIGQPRSLGKSGPILRVARSVDGSSSANPARDSPERKASQSGARSSAATACTCKTRSEEHQGDYADYLHSGRASGLLGKARVLTLRRNLSEVGTPGVSFFSSTQDRRTKLKAYAIETMDDEAAQEQSSAGLRMQIICPCNEVAVARGCAN